MVCPNNVQSVRGMWMYSRSAGDLLRRSSTKRSSEILRRGLRTRSSTSGSNAVRQVAIHEDVIHPAVHEMPPQSRVASTEAQEAFFDALLETVEKKWNFLSSSQPCEQLGGSLDEEPVEPNKHVDGSDKVLTGSVRLKDLIQSEDIFLPADFKVPNDATEKAKVMRQIQIEQQAKDHAIELFTRFTMQDSKWGAHLKSFEGYAQEWIPHVTAKLKEKLETYKKSKDASAYYLAMIDLETAATIAVHHVIIQTSSGEKFVIDLSKNIGKQVMSEISYKTLKTLSSSWKEDDAGEIGQKTKDLLRTVDKSLRKKTAVTTRKQYDLLQLASSASKEVTREAETLMRIGAHCLSAVLEGCYVISNDNGGELFAVSSSGVRSGKSEGELPDSSSLPKPAFDHELTLSSAMRQYKKNPIKYKGVVRLNSAIYERLQEDMRFHALNLAPKNGPMIIKPRPWKTPNNGGYLISQAGVMRTRNFNMQKNLLDTGKLTEIFDGLNALGNNPWKVHGRVFDVAQTLWERGGGVAGLMARADIPMTRKKEFFDQEELEDMLLEEKDRLYRRERFEVQKQNRELHAERCSMWYKFEAAREFRKEPVLYFPHNVDFRGRAYPLSGQISHIGDDLSRGLLTFAGAGPEVGERGLYWLKVRFANFLGHDKLPFDERAAAADENMAKALKVANDPLGDENLEWWSNTESPFQLLATCFELGKVMRNGERAAVNVNSCLPIHQDGSCNGLQHYAALGRDAEGGAAVNLTPRDRPADVYTEVLKRTVERAKADALEGQTIAESVLPFLSRKVVKQTVMTSVYGVTKYGAREQVRRQLVALKYPRHECNQAATYVADLTLSSLGDLFTHADETRKWLADAAYSIAASGKPVHWVSPLGLPCVQPYTKEKFGMVTTTLQQVKFKKQVNVEDAINKLRQREAFSPNFIHSIDSSHMLITAKRCAQDGLFFASVHDSFWTAPAQVDEMNRTLREAFVDLHSRKILQELLEHFRLLYPAVEFRPLPGQGELDLNVVKESDYFFS